MVYRISGITRRVNRESTSGRTIRKLPLTNRSGLGVLHNPRYTVSEKLRIIQFAKQNGNRAAERGFGVERGHLSKRCDKFLFKLDKGQGMDSFYGHFVCSRFLTVES